ncbi:uridine kinase family protein [Oscillibacter sp.]|uniref:uridine kinase family protein n=1 Tax=Oscillibacter sp. TaxID=1945593 RepID=UPI002D7EF48D|nr:hypothetical protein [Oscillibacter sp.]
MSGDFLEIVKEHWARYPLMEPQDFAKLAYQSEFGPAHMVQSPDKVLAALLAERKEAGAEPLPPEPIGGGLCRFPITQALSALWELPLIGRMFTRTMALTGGTAAGLSEKLEALASLPVPGMGAYLEGWRREGCPPISHSEAFRSAYAPHYRVLRQDFARFLPALIPMEKLARDTGILGKRPILFAVDGRCGSGKTGFAKLAAEVLACSSDVVHMDDFYLPPERRAEDWMEVPAGNMDLERLRREVLDSPDRDNGDTAYRPYDCRAGLFKDPVELWEPLAIVEGTYSQHPSLAKYYDYKIFLTCEREEQTRRLRVREGDYFPTFDRVWRTLEERYFAACGTEGAADLVVDTTGFFD